MQCAAVAQQTLLTGRESLDALITGTYNIAELFCLLHVIILTAFFCICTSVLLLYILFNISRI